MAPRDDFDEGDWFDKDGQPRDAAEFAEFLGIVLTPETDQQADDEFLAGILPRLHAEGKHAHAKSLIEDYVRKHGKPLDVRKHGKPLEFDG